VHGAPSCKCCAGVQAIRFAGLSPTGCTCCFAAFAGWDLARALLRPRSIKTMPDGVVVFVNDSSVQRISAGEALKHRWERVQGRHAVMECLSVGVWVWVWVWVWVHLCVHACVLTCTRGKTRRTTSEKVRGCKRVALGQKGALARRPKWGVSSAVRCMHAWHVAHDDVYSVSFPWAAPAHAFTKVHTRCGTATVCDSPPRAHTALPGTALHRLLLNLTLRARGCRFMRQARFASTASVDGSPSGSSSDRGRGKYPPKNYKQQAVLQRTGGNAQRQRRGQADANEVSLCAGRHASSRRRLQVAVSLCTCVSKRRGVCSHDSNGCMSL